MKFTLLTKHPVAVHSRDHAALHELNGYPFVNNSRSTDFNKQLQDLLKGKANRSVLDIGCAGGGMVHDVLEMGIDAVGLEGSDYCLKYQLREWPLIPENLFTCDVTKPFNLSSSAVGPHAFDVVTAWEFMEHIEEPDLSVVLGNINRHTHEESVFICSIADFSSTMNGVELHRTIQSGAWWEALLKANGWRRDDALERHFQGQRVRTGSHNFSLKKCPA